VIGERNWPHKTLLEEPFLGLFQLQMIPPKTIPFHQVVMPRKMNVLLEAEKAEEVGKVGEEVGKVGEEAEKVVKVGEEVVVEREWEMLLLEMLEREEEQQQILII
jgi:hypothetical protein